MSARKALAAELPIKTVLSKHQTAVIISVLLGWMLNGAIVAIILITYLMEFGSDPGRMPLRQQTYRL